MSKRSFIPSDDIGDITVYIGAHVPPRLYQLMVEEATQAGLSHSKMIGRILTERYSQSKGPKEWSKRESRDDELTELPTGWALPDCHMSHGRWVKNEPIVDRYPGNGRDHPGRGSAGNPVAQASPAHSCATKTISRGGTAWIDRWRDHRLDRIAEGRSRTPTALRRGLPAAPQVRQAPPCSVVGVAS